MQYVCNSMCRHLEPQTLWILFNSMIENIKIANLKILNPIITMEDKNKFKVSAWYRFHNIPKTEYALHEKWVLRIILVFSL